MRSWTKPLSWVKAVAVVVMILVAAGCGKKEEAASRARYPPRQNHQSRGYRIG